MAKEEQLQIRISKEDKVRLKALAQSSGLDVSSFVLEAVLPSSMNTYQQLVHQLSQSFSPKIALAALHDFLNSLSKKDL